MICVEREELICSINLRGYFNLNSSTWKFTKNYNMKKHIIPCGEDVSIKNSQTLTTNFVCEERNMISSTCNDTNCIISVLVYITVT